MSLLPLSLEPLLSLTSSSSRRRPERRLEEAEGLRETPGYRPRFILERFAYVRLFRGERVSLSPDYACLCDKCNSSRNDCENAALAWTTQPAFCMFRGSQRVEAGNRFAAGEGYAGKGVCAERRGGWGEVLRTAAGEPG